MGKRKKVQIKTTAQDFRIFREECKLWMVKLGLTDWLVAFTHDPDKKNKATVDPDLETKSAIFNLASDWGLTEITNSQLKIVALHESIHVLLAPLVFLAASRCGVTVEDIKQAEETIVRKLTSIFGGEK